MDLAGVSGGIGEELPAGRATKCWCGGVGWFRWVVQCALVGVRLLAVVEAIF